MYMFWGCFLSLFRFCSNHDFEREKRLLWNLWFSTFVKCVRLCSLLFSFHFSFPSAIIVWNVWRGRFFSVALLVGFAQFNADFEYHYHYQALSIVASDFVCELKKKKEKKSTGGCCIFPICFLFILTWATAWWPCNNDDCDVVLSSAADVCVCVSLGICHCVCMCVMWWVCKGHLQHHDVCVWGGS